MNPDELFGYKVQFGARIWQSNNTNPYPFAVTIDAGDFYFCQVPCHCGAIACDFRFEEEHPVHAYRFHDCTPEQEP